jgi:hypothetical protein
MLACNKIVLLLGNKKSEDPSSIHIIARPNSIDVCFDNDILDSFDAPIEPTAHSNHNLSRDICNSIVPILDLLRPETFTVTVYCKNPFVVEYNIDDLLRHAKNDMKVYNEAFSRDDDDAEPRVTEINDLHGFFMDEILNKSVNFLVKTCIDMGIQEEIKGIECPVLHEPLKKTALKFKKCGHFISKEAYVKMDEEPGKSSKKCPLCRASHYNYDMINLF